MTEFCTTIRMIHNTSCPHTPQQNGVNERNNRSLLDIARSVMFQSLLPRKYWYDVVLTSSFLINCQRSSVLQGAIPFSMLRSNVDTFHVPLRVFGCNSFVHNFDLQVDNLSPHAIKIIF